MIRVNINIINLVILLIIISCSKNSVVSQKENNLPIATLKSPVNDFRYFIGDTVFIHVQSSDSDGEISNLTLLINDEAVINTEETSLNYNWITHNETVGDYLISVIAVDDQNDSSTVSVNGKLDNTPNKYPICQIISPLNNEEIIFGDSIEVVVEAYDPDGSISKVWFMLDGEFKNNDNSSPYKFSFSTKKELINPNHTISVRAFDNTGASTIDVVDISIIHNWKYSIPEFIGDGWSTTTLASTGVDTTLIYDLINTLINSADHRVHGILIARHGQLAFEQYFNGYRRDNQNTVINFDKYTLHDLASSTKSFTSALLGIAIDQGIIPSINTPIHIFFPEIPDLAVGEKANITIEHMINMASGIQWDQHSVPPLDPQNDLILFGASSNPWEMYLTRPLITSPGTYMNYSEGSINVVGEILRRTSGMEINEFANQYLFNHLNINESSWGENWGGWIWCSGDLFLKPRDMLKLGQLYLDNGIWNGVIVISEDWIQKTKIPYMLFNDSSMAHERFWLENADHYGYSHAWWNLLPESYGDNAFTASGWGQQYIMVLPEYDMTIVFTGGSQWELPLQTAHQMMTNYILPSIR